MDSKYITVIGESERANGILDKIMYNFSNFMDIIIIY